MPGSRDSSASSSSTVLSSVCHFWKADGLTANQPHPCTQPSLLPHPIVWTLLQSFSLSRSPTLSHDMASSFLFFGFQSFTLCHSTVISVCSSAVSQHCSLSTLFLISLQCTVFYYTCVFACLSSCLAHCLFSPVFKQSFLSTGPSVICVHVAVSQTRNEWPCCNEKLMIKSKMLHILVESLIMASFSWWRVLLNIPLLTQRH